MGTQEVILILSAVKKEHVYQKRPARSEGELNLRDYKHIGVLCLQYSHYNKQYFK